MSAAAAVGLPLKSTTPHLETTPLSIKKVMMATDFSEQSKVAAKYAARLARQMGSQLEFLHIVPEEFYVASPYMLAADLQKAERARGRAELREFTKKVPEARILRHKEIVLPGPVAELIVQTAEERAVDLLVLGSHGRSGVKKLALGSIAEKVIRHLHRPVLVTGPQCARQYADLKSVLLAVDIPMSSLRAAQYAVSIARQSVATLTVAHIFPKQSGAIDPDALQNTWLGLHALVPSGTEYAKRVQLKAVKENAAKGILRIAKRCKAGLIVTSPKERSALADHAPGALLSELIRHAQCPILAVPAHFS
jgi:nucleotide-binding universal stress UspA family protein